MPGFNYAHMHPSQAAEDLLHVDASASSVHSNADIQSRRRLPAAELPDGAWVQASRYDDGKMAEGNILIGWDLDADVLAR